MKRGGTLKEKASKPEATKCKAERTAEKNKKAHKGSIYQPQTAAKLIIVALTTKSLHNSEAVAIFDQVDGDSEFLSQLVNSNQMPTSRHKNCSLFHIN